VAISVLGVPEQEATLTVSRGADTLARSAEANSNVICWILSVEVNKKLR
jgi:hypothetical protein